MKPIRKTSSQRSRSLEHLEEKDASKKAPTQKGSFFGRIMRKIASLFRGSKPLPSQKAPPLSEHRISAINEKTLIAPEEEVRSPKERAEEFLELVLKKNRWTMSPQAPSFYAKYIKENFPKTSEYEELRSKAIDKEKAPEAENYLALTQNLSQEIDDVLESKYHLIQLNEEEMDHRKTLIRDYCSKNALPESYIKEAIEKFTKKPCLIDEFLVSRWINADFLDWALITTAFPSHIEIMRLLIRPDWHNVVIHFFNKYGIDYEKVFDTRELLFTFEQAKVIGEDPNVVQKWNDSFIESKKYNCTLDPNSTISRVCNAAPFNQPGFRDYLHRVSLNKYNAAKKSADLSSIEHTKQTMANFEENTFTKRTIENTYRRWLLKESRVMDWIRRVLSSS